MLPKDLLQSLKDNLERESSLEFQDVSVRIFTCDKTARAIVAKYVQGKWELFEVFARPIGMVDDISIGA